MSRIAKSDAGRARDVQLRITEVKVDGLFGIFNHEIPFRDEGVTIVHGLNGFGKTTILRIIFELFQGSIYRLFKIQFESLDIMFNDGTYFRLTNKAVEKVSQKSAGWQYEIGRQGFPAEFQGAFGLARRKEDQALFRIIDRAIPFIHRSGPDEWFDSRSGINLSTEEILQQYGEYLPDELGSKQDLPPEVKRLRATINCRFIETQRLLMEQPVRERELYNEPWRKTERPKAVVSRDAIELANTIQKKFSEYASKSQELDKTFPSRVMRRKSDANRPISEIESELKLLQERREVLIAAGLLDQEETQFDQSGVTDTDPAILRVLAVYIDDMRAKLAVFDELFSKVNLFAEIINKRFKYKRISMSRAKGMLMTDDQGRLIPLEALSSGEQHQLVLMYELIFKTPQNNLVLIDEPELSLHISWQKNFIPDLAAIAKLSGLYALVATHSPQIINDRWDLTVPLSGRNEL